VKALLISSAPLSRYNYHLTYGLVFNCLKTLGFPCVRWGGAGCELEAKDLEEALDKSEATHLFCLDMNVRGEAVREAARKRPHLFVVGSVLDLHYLRGRRKLFECCDRILVRDDVEFEWLTDDWRARSFPFAVNVDDLPPARKVLPWDRRRPEVYFRGALKNPVYRVRREALRLLIQRRMAIGGEACISMPEYFAELPQYRFGLTCSGTFGLRTAKSLEYAACGVMPLHDQPHRLEGFLPHVIGYGIDTVVAQVQALQQKGWKAWVDKAEENRQYVLTHHSVAARAEQLAEILGVGW
jgi:hypothetical protein